MSFAAVKPKTYKNPSLHDQFLCHQLSIETRPAASSLTMLMLSGMTRGMIAFLSASFLLRRSAGFSHPSPLLFSATVRSLRTFATTEYTIEEPGVDPEVLEKTIKKHWDTLQRYLSEKPIAEHTRQAFSLLEQQLQGNELPVILDSGCGTGRSTQHLATLYPDHLVIGVDRSVARLNKNYIYKQQSAKGEGNLVLVRAELADFWRCWLMSPIGKIEKHFLLYPNPYPKKRRFQNRWYAHPAFPLLMQLGGDEIVVRSNWKAYLEDFAAAASQLCDLQEASSAVVSYYEPTTVSIVDPSTEPWTNFEAKYFNVGETTYQLQIKKR